MKTQTAQIRAHIVRHNSITPMEALRKYGCLRLAARIWELKESGFSVVKTMVSRGSKRYARYVQG